MRPLVALAFLIAALSGANSCAPAQSNDLAALAVVAEPDCGLPLVVRSRSGRPGVERIRSGNEVRACATPSAGDIELACESADAVAAPGDQHIVPEYRISNALCAFTNDQRTQAQCSFTLSVSNAAPIQSDTALTHRFLDLSDETVHDDLVTSWHAGASCRPAP